MPPLDLLMRITTPSPDHDYPIHSPSPSLPPADNYPPNTDRLSIFDKRWPALFGANVRSETSSNLPAPSPRPNTPDKLVYPATETHSAFVSPDPEPSVAPDAELLARVRDCIASFDLTAAQQPRILNTIALLEQDLQNIADQSSSDLDTAHRAEALAQNSLITAKEAVALAQENVSVALAAKDRADQALIRVAQLRSQCESETSTATGEQAHANLESIYQVISRQAKDKVPVSPTGLSRDALSTISAELTRKIESPHGSRKRKRCQDHGDLVDSDLRCPPSKEPRIEQHVFPSARPSVESLAEAAREAWNQEAERRSVIPPDAVAAEGHEEDVLMKSAQGPPPSLSPEQDPLPPSEPNISKQDASFVAEHETEDPLQGQRRRELEEQKREITKFQMRERELQESQARRKDTENKNVVTLGDSKDGSNMLIPPAVLGTSPSAPNEGHTAKQQKTGVSDNLRKVEQRLAMQKQAPMAKRSGPAQMANITPPAPQSLIQKPTYPKDGQSASERYRQTQDSLQQLPDLGHGEERKIPDEASMNTATAAGVERAKFQEQTNDGAKQSQRTSMTPNVGNVVAQQTLTGSSIKARGKESRSPPVPTTRLSSAQVSSSTSPTQGTILPPRPSFQPSFPPLQPLNLDNVPRNSRLDSVPPIECIDESSGDPVPGMKNAATSSPSVQTHGASLPKATINPSVSEEVQSANLKPSPNIITTSGHKALPPASINDVVPKAEIVSPTIMNPPIIYPSPPRPSNNGVHSVFTATQQNTKGTPLHPPSVVATSPQDSISQLRNESHHRIAAAANSGSNASPLTSTLPARARMDLARDTQAANNERNRQSNSPPPPLFMAEQPSIPSSSHGMYGSIDLVRSVNKSYRSDARPSRGWPYGSSPRHTGSKRTRHRALDDDDERHWSPPRDRIACDTYIPRTPSGSPPVVPHCPLSKRIEGVYDPSLQNGNESFRPYHPVDPADSHVQDWRDTGNYYATQANSRLALVDRFFDRRVDLRGGAQPLRRGRQGRGGLRLEERIT